jgi:uncharacterized Zn-binding protein involved in type VI secretion
MTLPAARTTDVHICPQVTVLVPHIGGPIIPPCMPMVLVGNLPDARILDQATCVGPPDFIAQGEATVLIGGLPAARLFHATTHGGLIISGCPTVLIGSAYPAGGTINMKVAPDSTPAFVEALQKALATILPTRSGTEWMRQMAANGRSVTFMEATDRHDACLPDDRIAGSSPLGRNSTIVWDPNHVSNDPKLPGPQGSPGAAVLLAHEMVHALHLANEDDRGGPYDLYPNQRRPMARNEERSTAGTAGPVRRPDGTIDHAAPDYSHDVPTENSFRDDLGIPRRPTYYPSNWPGGPPW